MLLDGSIDSRESFQAVLERICKLACCAVSSARISPAFCVGSTLACFQKPDIAAVSVAASSFFWIKARRHTFLFGRRCRNSLLNSCAPSGHELTTSEWSINARARANKPSMLRIRAFNQLQRALFSMAAPSATPMEDAIRAKAWAQRVDDGV